LLSRTQACEHGLIFATVSLPALHCFGGFAMPTNSAGTIEGTCSGMYLGWGDLAQTELT
jgi:hypothetical protein